MFPIAKAGLKKCQNILLDRIQEEKRHSMTLTQSDILQQTLIISLSSLLLQLSLSIYEVI